MEMESINQNFDTLCEHTCKLWEEYSHELQSMFVRPKYIINNLTRNTVSSLIEKEYYFFLSLS